MLALAISKFRGGGTMQVGWLEVEIRFRSADVGSLGHEKMPTQHLPPCCASREAIFAFHGEGEVGSGTWVA